MFIQTERTPNPRTLKFLPGRGIASLPAQYGPCDAGTHPFLSEAFSAAEIENVFIGRDFVSVTLAEDTGWPDALKERFSELVREHLSGLASLAGREEAELQSDGADPKNAATVKKIMDLLETHVRPAVAADGGDIVFESYSDGLLTLSMKGACSGCPSSTATLRHGVQNLMRHFVPEVREVRAA